MNALAVLKRSWARAKVIEEWRGEGHSLTAIAASEIERLAEEWEQQHPEVEAEVKARYAAILGK